METQWSGFIKAILGLALAALFFYMMNPFLVPIILGAIIAIICFPLQKLGTRVLPKPISSLVITLGVVLGVLLPFSLVIYSTIHKTLGLISKVKLPEQTGGISGILDHPGLKGLVTFVERFAPIDEAWMQEQLTSAVHSILEKVSSWLAASLAGVPSFVLGFIIVILSLYFFLLDGSSFLRFLSEVSPLKDERSRRLYDTFQNSCRGVVFGLLASGGTQGVLTMIFFAITGLPDPALWGFIAGMLSLVPLFGSTPVSIGAVIYLFINARPGMGIVMIVGLSIIGLSDNVVRSMILKGSSEMHPLLALVSVFGAIQLFGATGIFLGPIIAAVFVTFVKMTIPQAKQDVNSASG